MPVEDIELRVDGDRVAGRVNAPAGSSTHGVVCLHGIAHGPYGGIFDRVAEAAAERGLQFLRYAGWQGWDDVRGHTLRDLHDGVDAAVDHLRSRGCTEVSLLGKSFGGAVALTYAPGPAERVALWAPAVPVDADAVDDPDATEVSGPGDLRVSPAHLAAVDVPVFVLHGDRDEVISVENSRRIVEHVQSGDLVELPGMDHSFEDEALADRIVTETLAFLAP